MEKLGSSLLLSIICRPGEFHEQLNKAGREKEKQLGGKNKKSSAFVFFVGKEQKR